MTETATLRLKLPSLEDPCWEDPAWRTRQYRKLVDKGVLTYSEIVLVTSHQKQTVWNWKSGTPGNCVSKVSLLALMLYVNQRGSRDAL